MCISLAGESVPCCSRIVPGPVQTVPLFIIGSLSLDGAICGVRDGCSIEPLRIRETDSVEARVTLPRSEPVYLSGACQLNICLPLFVPFMKRASLRHLWEGHPQRGSLSLWTVHNTVTSLLQQTLFVDCKYFLELS